MILFMSLKKIVQGSEQTKSGLILFNGHKGASDSDYNPNINRSEGVSPENVQLCLQSL